MIFYYVILLSLCWPQTRCIKDNAEGTFDQIATASGNVAHAIRQSNASTKNHQERLSSVPAPIGATVRYENSNGFVPMIAAATLSYDAIVSSSSRTNDLEQQGGKSNESNATSAVSAPDSSSEVKSKLAEDLAYSSEARIFLNLPGPPTNRRSSDFQDGPSAFELLKVNNDTPAVANYQDFYGNVHGTANTEIGSPDSPASRHPSVEKGRKVNNYIPNYGKQSHQTGDENIYARYYLYNGAQDAKKTTHEQEKVTGNYRQQSTANYDGHGQSAAAGQNAVPSSSRTNYETNEPTHGGTHDDTTESSRTQRHRFFKPVVVAESSNEADTKFGSQLQNDAGLGAGYKTSRNLESASSETSGSYEVYNDGSKQRNYHRLEDPRILSDDSTEYADHAERTRRMPKNRRRPAHVDPPRKPPKEHTLDDGTEEQDKHKYSASRLKSQRYKVKANPWLNDAAANHQDANDEEDVKYDHKGSTETKSTRSRYGSRSKNANSAWNQASANLGISHSNAIELDHLEKPNYVVPFNLLPLTNFDHATALGNSQGFDVSNAVLHNFVTAAPIGAYTTTAPLLSTPQPVLAQNLAFHKNLGISTSVPDVIVGQNTFQNPLQTVLLPQSNGQGKIAEPLRTTYLPNTVTPVFALTSSLTPTLQNVRLQNVQGNVTPTSGSVVQHIPVNQVHSGVQQLIVPTAQTFPSFLQTPFQIQVNPHGLQGQNLISQGNPLGQGLSTTPAIPESRINGDSRKKNANILTSAGLAIGQNEQKHTAVNGNYLQNHNAQAVRPKAFVQASQVVPTVQTLSGIALSAQQLPDALALQRSRVQQGVKLQGNGADDDAVQQFQAQLGRMQLMKGNKFPGIFLQTADNAASHTNNVNNVNALTTSSGQAHLPNVGAKNVEIVNPNIKPSPVDTTVSAFGTTMHYPTAVFTTPIPIFSTITPVTPHTVTLQNYVNSLTESGTKTKQLGVLLDPKTSQTTERPMFNPINFIPNLDIIKNQNALNNKLPVNEPLQPGLSLVPVMPGGNFFKPSFSAQNELVIKPKLASDLQQYAEEMFKESLKTMYNSQKWNNDRKPYVNNSEASDLAKLRLELQRLKASLADPKYRDILEAHQSENKVRATDAFKYDGDKKNPDVLLQTLEHLLKSRPAESIHIYHGSSRPGRKQKPTEDPNFGSDFAFDEFKSDSRLKDFLTPPRPDAFRGPFQEKPVKKRPEIPRYKTGPRKRPSSTRPINLDTSASNIDIYLDGSQHRRPPFDHDGDFRHQSSFDAYPTFAKSTPSTYRSGLRELKAKNKDYDPNHPRMHNYLGMLMKNKQLPSRNTHYRREKDKLREFFENEKHRLQQEFYDDTLKDYLLNKYEGASRSGTAAGRKVYSRNGTT